MEPTCLDRRNTAYLGIVAALIFSLMWTAAVLADGSWVLGAETLSDLGHPSRAGHPVFNAGVLIAGVLLAIFALGMLQIHQDRPLAKASMAVAALASLFLVGVGVFPIHVSPQHTIVSYAFFGLMALALALWAAGDIRSGGRERSFGALTALILAVCLALLALTEVGMAEAVSVAAIMLWAVLLCLRMLIWESG